jgi:hypothetical protein
MVERLKRSLENLEPPECPQCHVEMKWFESKLVEPEPSLVIEHQFICETCGRTRKQREKVDAAGGGRKLPGRLVRPPKRMASAA